MFVSTVSVPSKDSWGSGPMMNYIVCILVADLFHDHVQCAFGLCRDFHNPLMTPDKRDVTIFLLMTLLSPLCDEQYVILF